MERAGGGAGEAGKQSGFFSIKDGENEGIKIKSKQKKLLEKIHFKS